MAEVVSIIALGISFLGLAIAILTATTSRPPRHTRDVELWMKLLGLAKQIIHFVIAGICLAAVIISYLYFCANEPIDANGMSDMTWTAWAIMWVAAGVFFWGVIVAAGIVVRLMSISSTISKTEREYESGLR